jgi:HK97 family phage major capsid protein
MKTNQDLLFAAIQSAMKAMTTTDLGKSKLTETQQKAFVRTISQSTKMLDGARRIDMKSHTHNIDRIGFATRIMQAANEGQAPSRTTDKPTAATNVLESVAAKAIVGITDDTLQDNIEGERFPETLRTLIAQRCGVDLEELYVNGNKASLDTYLKLTNGWLVKCANSVTAAGGAFAATKVEEMFEAMIDGVDKKYLRDRSLWTINANYDVENAYRDVLRARGTGMGDAAQTTAGGLAYKGFKVQDIGNMPTGTAILVPPANLVYGIYKDIYIEPARHAEEGYTNFIASMRVDCHFEDENAACVASGFTA